MRKTILPFLSLLLVIAMIFDLSDGHTNSVQPPSARTGAPGELTCGISTCHNNVPNTNGGNVAIAFSGTNNKYVPGSSYTVTVTVTDAAQSRFGFEMTSLDTTYTQAGSFAEISGSTDVSFPFSSNGRLYVAHHNANSSNTFNFFWTAPLTNVGDVILYAAGNAANNNNQSTGDHIYTTNLTISPDFGIHVTEVDENSSFFVQNVSAGKLNLEYRLDKSSPVTLRLINLSGQSPMQLYNRLDEAGTHSHSFEVGEIVKGVYIVVMQTENSHYAEKILIQ